MERVRWRDWDDIYRVESPWEEEEGSGASKGRKRISCLLSIGLSLFLFLCLDADYTPVFLLRGSRDFLQRGSTSLSFVGWRKIRGPRGMARRC